MDYQNLKLKISCSDVPFNFTRIVLWHRSSLSTCTRISLVKSLTMRTTPLPTQLRVVRSILSSLDKQRGNSKTLVSRKLSLELHRLLQLLVVVLRSLENLWKNFGRSTVPKPSKVVPKRRKPSLFSIPLRVPRRSLNKPRASSLRPPPMSNKKRVSFSIKLNILVSFLNKWFKQRNTFVRPSIPTTELAMKTRLPCLTKMPRTSLKMKHSTSTTSVSLRGHSIKLLDAWTAFKTMKMDHEPSLKSRIVRMVSSIE